MTSFAIQLAVQALIFVGGGYWTWRACGRPNPMRGLTWLWCGLAGFSLFALGLQALIYLDLPLARTAPWAMAFVAIGSLLVLTKARRIWPTTRRHHRREMAIAALAVLIAAGSFAIASWRLGPDRFWARSQPDQLNYVMTAQAIADEKFSITYDAIGLRPWLYRTMETKHQRLTQCVVLGGVAVSARTDAQRAWSGVAIGFVALLAAAVFGFARNIAGLPVWAAAASAVAGATLPAVGLMFDNGYFSQLGTLWTLAALPALGRPGAVARRTRVVCMMAIAGYLAGGYTEFFPIGAAMGAMMLLAAHATWRMRVAEVAIVFGGALLLTTGYLRDVGRFLATQVASASQPGFLSELASEGGTWLGWCRHFFAGSAMLGVWAGAVLSIAALAGIIVARGHRRRWWLVALSPPLAVMVYLAVQPQLPVYAFQKLSAALAPIVTVLAISAFGRGLTSARRALRYSSGLFAAVMAAGVAASGIAFLRAWTPSPFEGLWQARERVEAAPGHTYLIAQGHRVTAGWLAYFARASSVYFDLPAISDRRVPSESQAFRRIPANASLVWLDVERAGPVERYEPTPGIEVRGTRETRRELSAQVHVLGSATSIEIERSAPAGETPRRFELELGITPMTGRAALEVAFSTPAGDGRRTWQVNGPTLLTIPLQLAPGTNRFELSCATADGGGSGSIALLQSISLNRTDPLP